MRAQTVPIHAIIGPTAVGKTALGIKLAQLLDGEIISADSRQIYKELSIGSAKPTTQELALVPHHFIDELRLGEYYSAGLFAEQAVARIGDILERNRVPIVVGGSTLYLHALVHGLSPLIPSDFEVRTSIRDRLADLGKDALYEELCQIDPDSASTMDSTKTARVMRALEVFELTSTPLSKFHEVHKPPPYSFHVTELTLNRSVLYRRIEQRVDAMLAAGLIEEVQNIRNMQLDRTLPALKSIGYKEPLAYLDGLYTLPDMIEILKRNSRRYAKRQTTWFRRYKTYQRISADTPDDVLIETLCHLFEE
jgi:tRNA dimethylallyltransferase